jgi:hypothetical protein
VPCQWVAAKHLDELRDETGDGGDLFVAGTKNDDPGVIIRGVPADVAEVEVERYEGAPLAAAYRPNLDVTRSEKPWSNTEQAS